MGEVRSLRQYTEPDWSELMTQALDELRQAEDHFRLIHMNLESELYIAKQHLTLAQGKLKALARWK